MLRTNEHSGEAPAGAPRQDLANLLFGAYRHRVLSLLLLRPGDGFHVRRIARLTGVPAGSLHRELRLLAGCGLLRSERSGNQIRYCANEDSPVYGELVAVLDKTAGAPPTLESVVAERSPGPPQAAFPVPKTGLAALCRRYGVKRLSLFGPAARGELRPDGDIGLLVEFDPRGRATSFDLSRMQEELSRLFGDRRVHLASVGALRNPLRRKAIEPDLKRLYVARQKAGR